MCDKKEKILNAAIELFSEHGVGVPTAKIAKNAGVSNGTLFNYFATKQELIDAMYLHIKYIISQAIINDIDFSADVKEIFYNLWRGYIGWACTNPRDYTVIDLLNTSQILSPEVITKGRDFFSDINDAAIRAIDEKKFVDLPCDYICEVAGSLMNATINYIQKNELTGAEYDKAIDRSYNIYCHGVYIEK
tara:strand:- start:39888 stop:40457 length:570 start_codon:yes stop_codon:yes gene_type:complete